MKHSNHYCHIEHLSEIGFTKKGEHEEIDPSLTVCANRPKHAIIVRPLDFTIDYEAVYPMCDEHFYDLKASYRKPLTEQDAIKLREYKESQPDGIKRNRFQSWLEFRENRL